MPFAALLGWGGVQPVSLILLPALQPAEVVLDEARKQQLQAEADAAAQAPLPEDDDDII